MCQKQIEEQKTQAAAAMEAMKKQFQEQIQVVRKKNLIMRTQAQTAVVGAKRGLAAMPFVDTAFLHLAQW